MEEKPDNQLIAEFKSGDSTAMTRLFERHYPSCLRLARTILRSDDDSQDAVQSAYLSAFRHFATFREEAAFRTWIKRIVVNCCLMQMRKPENRVERAAAPDSESNGSLDFLVSTGESPEESTWRRELAAAHSRAVETLPSRLREVYLLCAVSGLTASQAADRMGATVPAVKTRLFRARAVMRSRLKHVWHATR